jgi:NAD(P)-dependent dehydrogenase (short-subunit alcohol dehydrogenase family)
MTATKIVLILGAGPNIGKAVAAAFAAEGYKTALAARSLKPKESTAEQLNIKADFSDPSSIAGVFATVEKKLGAPSVVIYNGNIALFPTSLPIIPNIPYDLK